MAVKWNNAAVMAQVRTATMRGIVRATEEIRNEAISLVLNTRKSGRIYRRRGTEHRASAPGEPFASDTGKTVGSIRTVYDPANLRGTITADENGLRLEVGTRNMEPRPWLRPAIVNKKGVAAKYISEEISKEFNK